jgi:Xaa-Pro aminopeptidase
MPSKNMMNVARYQREVDEEGLAGVVAASPNSVFYSTGALVFSQRKTSPQSSSRLIDDRPAYAVLDGSATQVRLIVSEVEKSLACEDTWLKDVWAYREYKDNPVALLAQAIRELGLANKRVGIEKSYLRQSEIEQLVHLLPEAKFVESDSLWNRVRAVKTPAEIQILKRAANITEEAMYKALRLAKIGWTERQLADLMVDNLLELGANSVYICVVGAGKNVMDGSNRPGPYCLAHGDLVHLDFGGKFKGYGSDIARTAVVGRASSHQREVYKKYLNAQRRTINYMRPGVQACDVFAFWKQAIVEEGLKNSLPHAGHGFALGGHDYPMLQPREKTILEPNMLFYVEPLFKDSDLNEAYHVEDLVLITEGDPEILSEYSATEEMFTIDWQS